MTEEVKNPEIQETTAPAGNEPANSGAELNINDLAAIRSIIDVASTRGAFKAAEMAAVGTVYNKLNTFLESVTAKKE